MRLAPLLLILCLSGCSENLGRATYGDAGGCPETACTKEREFCDGAYRVSCATDERGCLVETRTNCRRETMDGVCRFEREQASCVPDLCADVASPCTAAGSRCDGDTLVNCSFDSLGCLVETRESCDTASGLRCRDTMGTARCTDPCGSNPLSCDSEAFCSGSTLVECAPDADGCLVESTRTPCTAWEACLTDDTGARCTDLRCPEAVVPVLSCADTMVSGTSDSGSMVGASWCGQSSSDFEGRERIYRFVGADPQDVDLSLGVASAGIEPFSMFVLNAGDGLGVCNSDAECADVATARPPASLRARFATSAGWVHYIVVENRTSEIGASTVPYGLFISCTPISCGDGRLSSGENCDDGNTTSGDGCSDSCVTEVGHRCLGEPSFCEREGCGDGALSRLESCDDMNMVDFDGCSAFCNLEFSGESRTINSSIVDDALRFRRPGANCAFAEDAGDYFFRAFDITNPTVSAQTLSINANALDSLSSDIPSMLILYEGGFNAGRPLEGCARTSDPAGAPSISEITIPAGATITVVATTVDPSVTIPTLTLNLSGP